MTLHARVLRSASRSLRNESRNSSSALRRVFTGSRSLVGSSSRRRSNTDISIGLLWSLSAMSYHPILQHSTQSGALFMACLKSGLLFAGELKTSELVDRDICFADQEGSLTDSANRRSFLLQPCGAPAKAERVVVACWIGWVCRRKKDTTLRTAVNGQ